MTVSPTGVCESWGPFELGIKVLSEEEEEPAPEARVGHVSFIASLHTREAFIAEALVCRYQSGTGSGSLRAATTTGHHGQMTNTASASVDRVLSRNAGRSQEFKSDAHDIVPFCALRLT